MENEKWATILQKLSDDRGFSAKDLGLTYRVLNDWTKKGLISDHRNEEGQWRKFSIFDVMEISIYRQLREVGFSVERILLFKNFLHNKEHLLWKKGIITNNPSEKKSFPDIVVFFALALSEERGDFYFIFPKEHNKTFFLSEPDVLQFIVDENTTPLVFVNLSEILRKLGLKEEKPRSKLGSVLKEIQSSETSEISIKTQQTGDVLSAKKTQFSQYDPSKKSLLEIVKDKNQNVIFSLNDEGKITSIKHEKKIT